MPTNNPSIHYLGVIGTATIWGDHAQCEAQWERIKAERSSEYGPDGAYNFGGCNSHGIRMVGRGWDRDSAANGQENGVDYNPGSRALCVLVGTDDEITPQCGQMVAAFAEEAYSRGMERPLRAHSEFVATECCGDHLRETIAGVNAGTITADSIPDPLPPPPPPPTLPRKASSMWTGILYDTLNNFYVDDDGHLTQKYYQDNTWKTKTFLTYACKVGSDVGVENTFQGNLHVTAMSADGHSMVHCTFVNATGQWAEQLH